MNVKERIAEIRKAATELDKKPLEMGSSVASKSNLTKAIDYLKKAPSDFTEIIKFIAPIVETINDKRKQDPADKGLLSFLSANVFCLSTVEALQDELVRLQKQNTAATTATTATTSTTAATTNGTATTADTRTSADTAATITSLEQQISTQKLLITNLQKQISDLEADNANLLTAQGGQGADDVDDDNGSVAVSHAPTYVSQALSTASRMPEVIPFPVDPKDSVLYSFLLEGIKQTKPVAQAASMFSEIEIKEICAIVALARVWDSIQEHRQTILQFSMDLKALFLKGERANLANEGISAQQQRLYSKLVSTTATDSPLPATLKQCLYQSPPKAGNAPKIECYGDTLKKLLKNPQSDANSNVTTSRGAAARSSSTAKTPSRSGVATTTTPAKRVAEKRTGDAAGVSAPTSVKKANSGLTAGNHPNAFTTTQDRGVGQAQTTISATTATMLANTSGNEEIQSLLPKQTNGK